MKSNWCEGSQESGVHSSHLAGSWKAVPRANVMASWRQAIKGKMGSWTTPWAVPRALPHNWYYFFLHLHSQGLSVPRSSACQSQLPGLSWADVSPPHLGPARTHSGSDEACHRPLAYGRPILSTHFLEWGGAMNFHSLKIYYFPSFKFLWNENTVYIWWMHMM